MSRRILVAGLMLVLLVGGAFLLLIDTEGPTPSASELRMQKKMLAKAAAQGSKDDPEARARFAWMKYHDPKTGQIPEGV
jgi:hypothetical protein